MSIATFAMALGSGIQAVLYLSRFGTNARTDGFFVAFAVYTTFGVFAQSLRLTSVPLLVEPGARISVRRYAAALALIAVPVLIATVIFARPLSHLLAPGLTHTGQAETATGLSVLGVAMTLQLWAAGGATVMAIRDRFMTVAAAYIAGAITGLIVFVAVMGVAGVQTLGWSMLAMAVVTTTWMLVGVRVSGGLGGRRAAGERRSRLRDVGLILGSTPVYLAFNMLFVVTLAFASRSQAGDSTVLSYAYLFASYLVAGTGMALGMSRIPEMTRTAREQRRAVVLDTVPQGYRYAILIVAPALALLLSAGAPLIHTLLPSSLKLSGVATLRTFTALLVPWTVAALLVNLLLPAMFAANRAGLLNLLTVPILVCHVGVTAAAYALFGVNGAVGAFFVVPACLAGVLMLAGAGERSRGLARGLALNTAGFVSVCVAAFGGGWWLASLLGSGLLADAVAIATGIAGYFVGLVFLARPQIDLLRAALSRAPAPSGGPGPAGTPAPAVAPVSAYTGGRA
jgi:peptidoglycan biosynthesis protein MviN/MurJ (putative lipid II flippase)